MQILQNTQFHPLTTKYKSLQIQSVINSVKKVPGNCRFISGAAIMQFFFPRLVYLLFIDMTSSTKYEWDLCVYGTSVFTAAD